MILSNSGHKNMLIRERKCIQNPFKDVTFCCSDTFVWLHLRKLIIFWHRNCWYQNIQLLISSPFNSFKISVPLKTFLWWLLSLTSLSELSTVRSSLTDWFVWWNVSRNVPTVRIITQTETFSFTLTVILTVKYNWSQSKPSITGKIISYLSVSLWILNISPQPLSRYY